MTDISTDTGTNTGTTVGIIGDGQLGMLLCQAAPALGLPTVMLTSDASSAAAQAASVAIEGAMDDAAAIADLIARCDVITYEREDIPCATIAQLRAAEAAGQVACYPPLDAIEILQDKALQKTWLADNHLATLPFAICHSDAEDNSQLLAAGRKLGFPLVQKALRGGFDGRGVQVLRDAQALKNAWPGQTMLEQFAGNFREIAVLVVRGKDGEMRHFGPVDMTFESDYSVLDTVSAPGEVSAAVEARATDLAYRAVAALEGVGVFGVEMFLLADDEVLINEIAPRVHNSGHYTLEACASSQFEQHMRAVAGLALNACTLRQPAAMRNLLCTPALKAQNLHRKASVESNDAHTVTYWYGKSPARLMRKLGHITALGASATDALAATKHRWNTIQEEARQS